MSHRRDEDDRGEVVDGKPIVSGRDALPLNDVSAPVCDAVERIDDSTGGSARDDGFDASGLESNADQRHRLCQR